MKSMRGTILYLAGVISLLALVFTSQSSQNMLVGGASQPAQSVPALAPTSSQPPDQSLSLSFEGPLLNGIRIPLSEATELLRKCECPELPPEGPVSIESLQQAWVDPKGELALEFVDKITMTFSPEDRTAAAYVDAAAETIAAGQAPGAVVVPIRGTFGMGDDHPEAISALTWKEGLDLITIYGEGGQSLSELMVIVSELPACEC